MNIEREDDYGIDEYQGGNTGDVNLDFEAFANIPEDEDAAGEEAYPEHREGQYESQYDGEAYEEEPQYEMSEAEIQRRKAEIVNDLRDLKSKGHIVDSSLSMQSDLVLLEQELDLLKSRISKQAEIQISRQILLGCASVIENGAIWNDPNTPLTGWTKSFGRDISSYDDLLVEIYRLYAPQISGFHPLLTLTAMVTMNAVLYCASQKVASSGGPSDSLLNAMSSLKQESQNITGPSNETMDMFNELMEEEEKPKRKYTKKNKK